jgi:hypothetical protein
MTYEGHFDRFKGFHFARSSMFRFKDLRGPAEPLRHWISLHNIARDCRSRSERKRRSFTASFVLSRADTAVALALRSSAPRSMEAANGSAYHGGGYVWPRKLPVDPLG